MKDKNIQNTLEKTKEKNPKKIFKALASLVVAGTVIYGVGDKVIENVQGGPDSGLVNVDPKKLEHDMATLEPDEFNSLYKRIVVKNGDNLTRIANDHIEEYDLDVDNRVVIEVLRQQNDGTSVVHSGDTFYLPNLEDEQDKG